ncbi:MULTISPECIES: type IV pilin protein [Vibrio]|uniref:type IV pilin protein n=1 Tax=Vibrio TaxID=662 RepID=UPI001493B001|nr:type IV pilin protein [Vibrio coralliilyticus]NOH62198.1 prepilin-type N-terminal cleavage/methylation domain-containing protein [Vibrio sp. RE88]WFB47519.1 type IV pilin protein [Vibrio coralliilyticus]
MIGVNSCKRSKKSLIGMTLLELLIVVTLIGILAMFAYPSYLEQVRKSHRITAITDLARIQLELESSYNGQYDWHKVISSGECTVCISDQNRFVFSATSNASAAYIIKATAQANSQQNLDSCLQEHGVDYLSLDATNKAFPLSCWQ